MRNVHVFSSPSLRMQFKCDQVASRIVLGNPKPDDCNKCFAVPSSKCIAQVVQVELVVSWLVQKNDERYGPLYLYVGRAQHNKEAGRCILWIIAAPVHIKSIFSIYQPTTKTRHQKRRREQQQTCRRRCYSIQLELGSLLCSPTQLTDRSMLQSIIE